MDVEALTELEETPDPGAIAEETGAVTAPAPEVAPEVAPEAESSELPPAKPRRKRLARRCHCH